MILKDYVEARSKEYKQDKYSMSIRELISMHNNNELNLSPVYQRIFRWDNDKASKLIESLILGIPLPPFFVSVKNGTWEIVDGVQRISTLLWFFGKLNDEKHSSPLVLSNLEILEELNGKTYVELKAKYPDVIFEYFDLRRIDLNLLISNNIESEYELFNRLNTGGVHLSAQEIRNFLISKLNKNLYDELKDFKTTPLCKSVLTVSDRQTSEDYEMELLVYFLIIINTDVNFYDKKGLDIFENEAKKYSYSRDKFIDICITKVLQNNCSNINIENIFEIFKKIAKIDRPFAKSRKFSPFLYICLISFMHYHKKNNYNILDILEKIKCNITYKKKANRWTNVVDQFINGIKIGKGLLENE